jgi:phosphoribosylanthranilate isomerase
MTWVKICGIRDETDLRVVLDSGSDAIGFLVGQKHFSEDFIDSAQAAALVKKIPRSIETVLVTYFEDPEEIYNLWEEVGSDTVQIHSQRKRSTLQSLREAPFDIIQALHVEEGLSLEGLEGLCSRIVLDTKTENRIGGTGQKHDWNISRRISREFSGETILAGGLGPGNLAEAKSFVQPAGVDVNSGVEVDGKKDRFLCQEFVRLAR